MIHACTVSEHKGPPDTKQEVVGSMWTEELRAHLVSELLIFNEKSEPRKSLYVQSLLFYVALLFAFLGISTWDNQAVGYFWHELTDHNLEICMPLELHIFGCIVKMNGQLTWYFVCRQFGQLSYLTFTRTLWMDIISHC